jgi:hypothetical protein
MREVSGSIPENTRALVASILHQVTGLNTDAIEHIKGRGMNNSVTVASTPQGRFVIRTNVESHLFRYRREAWCYQQLEGSPVRTPTVLGCGARDGHSYSVAQFISDSGSIDATMDQHRVWRTLGMYAQHLNAIAPPTPDSEAASYFPATWERQVLDDVTLIFKTNLWQEHGLLSAEQQGAAKGYLLECATSQDPRGICQFDLTTANAVICNHDYDKVYLLDLESANIAPVPYYQLGCLAAEKGLESDITRAFFEGYGYNDASQTFSEIERFTLYRLMRATAWARDRAPNLLRENLERTRPLLERVSKRNFS